MRRDRVGSERRDDGFPHPIVIRLDLVELRFSRTAHEPTAAQQQGGGTSFLFRFEVSGVAGIKDTERSARDRDHFQESPRDFGQAVDPARRTSLNTRRCDASVRTASP